MRENNVNPCTFHTQEVEDSVLLYYNNILIMNSRFSSK